MSYMSMISDAETCLCKKNAHAFISVMQHLQYKEHTSIYFFTFGVSLRNSSVSILESVQCLARVLLPSVTTFVSHLKGSAKFVTIYQEYIMILAKLPI